MSVAPTTENEKTQIKYIGTRRMGPVLELNIIVE